MKFYLWLIFLCYFLSAFSATESGKREQNELVKKQKDSTYDVEKRNFELKHAKYVVKWYDSIKNTNEKLKPLELKQLALSYAILNDAPKAVHFTDKYIKTTRKIKVLHNDIFSEIAKTKEFSVLKEKYLPEVNFGVLYFLATAIIGFFLSIIINLRKQGDFTANLLISTFIFIHSLFIFQVAIFLSKFNYKYPHSLFLATSFSFLYGPLLYFYFKRISQRYRFKPIDVLHFVPTLILIIYFLPIYFSSEEHKSYLMFHRKELLQSTYTVLVVLKSISLVVYVYLSYRIYKKILLKRKEVGSQVLKWGRNIIVLNVMYVVFYILYGYELLNEYIHQGMVFPQLFFMSLIILYIAYTAYVHPKVFSKKYLFNLPKAQVKYKNSGLTNLYSNELKDRLLHLFEEEKIYRQNNLSLEILSKKLNTTKHSLSQVINEHFKMNFFNLLNKYRIAEAKEILKNDINKNLTIIDIAYDVGFNNKVTFNKAFKQETEGLTPREYLKTIDRSKA